MSNLLRATPERLDALHDRAMECCIAFPDEPLPPGSSQPTGRVGIEVGPDTGCAQLHVERGLTYSGPSEEVADWFASGTRSFDSYQQLREWVGGPLAASFAGHSTSTSDHISNAAAGCRLPEALLIDTIRAESILANDVIGQERSIRQLVAAAALHLARRRPRRPLTVLALGPTGVGKTLIAEKLADAIEEVGGDPCSFLRLDMTEFQERHSVAKLLGAPPGYVGFGDEPRLVNVLRNGQRAVVLIDEIEKAHSDVFLAIMNLMDAGRLTPASGPAVDARHAILIFTTNLGASELKRSLGDVPETRDDPITCDTLVREVLRSHGIAPELVGRLHSLLVLDSLQDRHLDEILRRSIAREAATFGLEITAVAPAILNRLREHRPDRGSGVRAWEHLISIELGPAFLDACRRGVRGELELAGDPPTIDRVTPD